jgi:hypothetical protein
MSLSRYPHGISSFGVPIIGSGPIITTGSVFFVDDSGSNNNSGADPTQPFATLAYAESQCTAGVGDIIVLMPGHAETVATAITLNTQGLKVVGLGHGALRPNFTVGVAGDIVTLDADDIWLDNIMFTGHATTAATSFIDINGNDDIIISNCLFMGAEKPTESITVAAGSDRLVFENCVFHHTAAGIDVDIIFEGGCEDPTIRNCYFNYVESAGVDEAAIWFSYSCTGILIDSCRVIGLADGNGLVTAANTTTGLVTGCRGHTADASDWIAATDALAVCDTYFAEPGTRSGGELLATSMVPGTSAAA